MGILVKDSLPAVTTCPLCGYSSLRIYGDPHGGAWYSCRACGELNADSIELFATVNNFTLKAAIKAIGGQGLFSQPIIAASAVDEYIIAANRRKRINEFWNNCRLAVKPKNPGAFGSVLQRLKISSSWDAGWRHGFGRHVGACSKKMLAQVFPGIVGRMPASAVLPFQDVPGRVVSFMLLNKYASKVYVDEEEEPEDGLFMLDSTTPGIPTVYAFSDPLVAMYAQRKHLMDSKLPAPIVAWGPLTNRAWEAVKSSRIIFWSNELDVLTLQQARRTDGYVAMRPSMGSKTPHEFIRDWYGINSLLGVMDESALYWLDAIKEFIVSNPPAESAEMLFQLSLTANEKQDLLSRCDANQLALVSEYLGDPSVSKSVIVDDQIITERNGEWLMRSRNGGPERTLSDAIIRLNKILSYPDGKKYYSGTIKYHGTIIPFTDTMERVGDKTYAWLNDKTVEAGVGAPEVLPNWHRRLLAVAKAFENPKVVNISDTVGMNGEVFNFPLFTVQHGTFMPKADVSYAKQGTPASTLEIPKQLTVEEARTLVSKDIPGVPEFWALMACIVINTLDSQLGKSARRPIGLVGSGAITIGNLVAQAYEMMSVDLNSRYWKKYISTDYSHALPMILRVDTKHTLWKRIAEWRLGSHNNVITPISAGAGACMSVTDDWYFLLCDKPLNEFPTQAAIRKILPLYLSHLQTQNFELPKEHTLHYQVLNDMCAWLNDTYPEYGDHTALFECAKVRVKTHPDGEGLIGNRFLWATIYLGLIHKIGVGEYRFTSEAVLIDRENQKVNVDIEKLSAQLRELGIPAWNWAEIIGEFRTHGVDVIVEDKLGQPGTLKVSYELFDRLFKRFTDRSILYKENS